MDAISAVVLGGTSMNGGRGTIAGTVIGAIVIGVLKNGMNLLGIDSSWQYIVQGIVILIAVYIDWFKQTGFKFSRKNKSLNKKGNGKGDDRNGKFNYTGGNS